MASNATVIEDAILCNQINKKGLVMANKGKKINRGVMLSNYTKETIKDCWESLTINIIQNYEKGKGTVIKRFGTFTYKRQFINLEGTTNEYFRDKREDVPVFIVSKELSKNCLPGEYTQSNTIRYYIQKENKNIPIIPLNFSEIAFRLSMSKEEVENIISNLIKNIGDAISEGTFKNKIFPNLGILFIRHNIIAMKFNDKFVNKIKDKNPKLIKSKKHFVSISTDFNLNKTITSRNYLRTFNDNFNNDLRADNSLNTKLDISAYDYLKTKYDIDVSKFPKHDFKITYNNYNENDGDISFINDYIPIKTRNKKNAKGKDEISNSPLFTLDDEIISSFEYYKGILILNSRKFDIEKYGTISKEEAISALLHSNISEKIDINLAKNIVEYYNKTDTIEYMKFIAKVIKDVQNYLNIKHPKSDLNYSQLKRDSLYNLKGNWKNGKKIFNKMNKSYSNEFFPQRKLNITKSPLNHKKNIIFPNIKGSTIQFNSNLRYIQEESKNDEISNNVSLETGREVDIFSNYYNFQEIKSIINNIKSIIPDLRQKYLTSISQNISSFEFLNILKKYNISYPKNTLDTLLYFIGIKDINAFSIEDFIFYIKQCKVAETKIGIKDFNLILDKLKDVIFINGGINFLFKNENNNLSCENFINIFKEKINCGIEMLKDVFYYLVKNDRNFTLEDYFKYFENNKQDLNDNYYITKMKLIIEAINEKHLTPDEYFNHLLSYNISTKDKFITRINWIKYLRKEKINLSAKDCDNLFKWIDIKQDDLLDMDEFVSKYNFTTKPLSVFKDIIYNNKLDIEDLANKMEMSINEIKKLKFEEFKYKIKKVDKTFSDTFIKNIFDEFHKNDMNNNKYVEQTNFLKEINYKKNDYYDKNKYFTQNYREVIIRKINYEGLKKIFEKRDGHSFGYLSKADYVSAISKILPEFTDDEHMIYVRIIDAFDQSGDNIIYSKILNSIFFLVPEKQNDEFITLCKILSNILTEECDNDFEKLMLYISNGIIQKPHSLNIAKPLTLEMISKFLKEKYNCQNISEKVILKLDVDSDGLVSYEDMKSVLKRYLVTGFFKYTNDASNPQINFYTKENLSEDKIKSIIKNLFDYMKIKNINEIGLFKKLDKNGDGFISNIEFNEEIDNIIKLSKDIKDQFFNFLDYYHNGMIDLTTFVSRLTNMENNTKFNFLSLNNNTVENHILEEFKLFCQKHKDFSDTEIFQIMDKDSDGIINYNDFEYFVINILRIPREEFNRPNLERVMMTLSLSKNMQIGINDIIEFFNISNGQNVHMNLKQVFKVTANQNLSDLKQNKDWINDIIERLGMYISEKYDSIQQFFDRYTIPGSGKFRFADFLRFQEENMDLFNIGFNLSKDEIMGIFTSLDSQKKNYLTKQDLENKLQLFNFYIKMHIDIKNFLRQNFENGTDAFKYFMNQNKNFDGKGIISYEEDKININHEMNNSYNNKFSIGLKEFFDAFENFFPKKYATNTILKYLNKYFKITIPDNNNSLTERKDRINFDEFNYIYFDELEENKKFIFNKNRPTKLFTNRFSFSKDIRKNFLKRSSSMINSLDLNNSNITKKIKINLNNLSTPFDSDPLNKMKRIIISTKYNLSKFFESMALNADSNLYLNKYKFRDMIKEFKIGLTNKEIDFIVSKCGTSSYDGKVNLKEFIKFLKGQNSLLREGNNNIAKFIGEIKSMIYKYYSNPIICFQNNDNDHSGKIDFETFKNILVDMYSRDNKGLPNFVLIKNAYDTLDLRKDGLIDIKEWCIAFASYNSKLDFDADKIPNGQEFFNHNNINDKTLNVDNNSFEHNRLKLREWETSGDVIDIYLFIHKNRKIIKEKIYNSDYTVVSGYENFIHSENLIKILKEFLPNQKLSQIQWKMIANIAQNENYNNLIDIYKFFRIVEITANNLMSQPKLSNIRNKNNKLIRNNSDNSFLIREKSLRNLDNSGVNMLRKFSCKTNLFKPKINMVNMINFKNVVLPGENRRIKKKMKKFYNK